MEPTIRHIRTQLQDIIIEKSDNDLRLILDGDLQFSFSEDGIYTDAMTRIPMRYLSAKSDIRVLILGGGDGFIADKISRYSSICSIDLCELDAGMISLCAIDDDIREFNHNIFSNPIVRVHIADAYHWITQQSEKYDLIIADFPDAHSVQLSQLFSIEMYRNIDTILSDDGVFITLGSEIQYTKRCFDCIVKTLGEIFPHRAPFLIDMPTTYGNMGIIMASRSDIFIHNADLKIYLPEYQLDLEINTISNSMAYNYFDEQTRVSGFIPGITNRNTQHAT